jgi:hypothetical protein
MHFFAKRVRVFLHLMTSTPFQDNCQKSLPVSCKKFA